MHKRDDVNFNYNELEDGYYRYMQVNYAICTYMYTIFFNVRESYRIMEPHD